MGVRVHCHHWFLEKWSAKSFSSSQFHVRNSSSAHLNAAITCFWSCNCELRSVIGLYRMLFLSQFWNVSQTLLIPTQKKQNKGPQSEPSATRHFLAFWFPAVLTGIWVCFTSVVLLFWLWNKDVMFKRCFISTVFQTCSKCDGDVFHCR